MSHDLFVPTYCVPCVERDERLRLRDEAILALLVYAGLRVQEVCDVQLRDLDLDGGSVTVRSGKGGRPRRVPFHSARCSKESV